MTTSNHDKADGRTRWIQELMAEKQRLADEAGMHVLLYMAQEHDGALKDVVFKLLKHAQAHPRECPDDCTFQKLFNS